ncbi:MAG TPA: ribonuclease Z [Candidatus Lokiarchaeia archaeon]|nr:ribonuclease Z [Candidatus Lokiarchaeia archaeon]
MPWCGTLRVVFLGTAASMSTIKARLQSIIYQLDDGSLLLFDTGEDVQRAFEEAKIKINKPLTIFITHMHGDHVIGLPGLLFRLGLLNRTKDVEIFGPRGLFFYLLAQRLTVGLITEYKILVNEIDLADNSMTAYPPMDVNFTLEGLDEQIKKVNFEDGIIKETKNHSIIVLNAEHTTIQSFSYIYKEQPKPGKFNPERAMALKIPRGHLWGKMQEGQTVTLKDGRIIDPYSESIVGTPREGRVIVLSGDTRPSQAIMEFIRNNRVNLLIHEATYTDEFQAMALDKKHSTIGEACAVAREGNVEKLALTHFSIRYFDDMQKVESEAKEQFNDVIIAHDNLAIEL